MGPTRLHPRVLREVAAVLTGDTLIMLERLWGSGDTPATAEKQTLCPSQEKGPRTTRDTAAQAVSGQYLGKSWSEFSWSVFVDRGGRREQLGTASKD